MKYYKASEVLPPAVVHLVQKFVETSVPEFSGGSIYFPSSVSSDVRNRPKKDRAYARALAIIAVHDGFTKDEAAVMAGTTRKTVNRWQQLYGEKVLESLENLRSERSVSDG